MGKSNCRIFIIIVSLVRYIQNLHLSEELKPVESACLSIRDSFVKDLASPPNILSYVIAQQLSDEDCLGNYPLNNG